MARSTVLRSGPITTMVTSRTRVVTAAAAARAANGSTLRYSIRSSTPRLANGPSSARLAHSSRQRPSAPAWWLASPTPTSMPAPPRLWFALVRPSGIMVRSGMRVGITLLIVVAVLAAALGLLWLFQRRLLYFPTPGPVPRPPRSSPGPRTSPSRPPTASASPAGSFPPRPGAAGPPGRAGGAGVQRQRWGPLDAGAVGGRPVPDGAGGAAVRLPRVRGTGHPRRRGWRPARRRSGTWRGGPRSTRSG